MCRTRFCRHRRSSKLSACLPGSGDAIVLVFGKNCVSAHNGALCTVSDPQLCCHRIHSPLPAPRCPCPAPDTLPLSVPVIEASCRHARAKVTASTQRQCPPQCRPPLCAVQPLRMRPHYPGYARVNAAHVRPLLPSCHSGCTSAVFCLRRCPCPLAPAVLLLRVRLCRFACVDAGVRSLLPSCRSGCASAVFGLR